MESRIADYIVCAILAAGVASVFVTIGFSLHWPLAVIVVGLGVIGGGIPRLWLRFR